MTRTKLKTQSYSCARERKERKRRERKHTTHTYTRSTYSAQYTHTIRLIININNTTKTYFSTLHTAAIQGICAKKWFSSLDNDAGDELAASNLSAFSYFYCYHAQYFFLTFIGMFSNMRFTTGRLCKAKSQGGEVAAPTVA